MGLSGRCNAIREKGVNTLPKAQWGAWLLSLSHLSSPAARCSLCFAFFILIILILKAEPGPLFRTSLSVRSPLPLLFGDQRHCLGSCGPWSPFLIYPFLTQRWAAWMIGWLVAHLHFFLSELALILVFFQSSHFSLYIKHTILYL